jgi:hypothetical protein
VVDADSKTVIGLFHKIETLEKPSVPNVALIDGVQDIAAIGLTWP